MTVSAKPCSPTETRSSSSACREHHGALLETKQITSDNTKLPLSVSVSKGGRDLGLDFSSASSRLEKQESAPIDRSTLSLERERLSLLKERERERERKHRHRTNDRGALDPFFSDRDRWALLTTRLAVAPKPKYALVCVGCGTARDVEFARMARAYLHNMLKNIFRVRACALGKTLCLPRRPLSSPRRERGGTFWHSLKSWPKTPSWPRRSGGGAPGLHLQGRRAATACVKRA